MKTLILALVSVVSLSFCVSKKKYLALSKQLEEAKTRIVNDSVEYNTKLNQQKNIIAQLQQEKSKTVSIQTNTVKVRKPTTLSQDEMYSIKASYIYNFTKQIEWPVNSSSKEFVISVVKSEIMYDKLKKRLEGKMTGNSTTKVLLVKKFEEGLNSNLLFVPSELNKQVDFIASRISSSNTLLVTERDEGTPRKCNCINMMMDGNNVDFEVDENQLRANGFKVSSQILNLESK